MAYETEQWVRVINSGSKAYGLTGRTMGEHEPNFVVFLDNQFNGQFQSSELEPAAERWQKILDTARQWRLEGDQLKAAEYILNLEEKVKAHE